MQAILRSLSWAHARAVRWSGGALLAVIVAGCMPTGDIDLFPKLPPPARVSDPVPPPVGDAQTLLEQYAKRSVVTRSPEKWGVLVVGLRDRSEESRARLVAGLTDRGENGKKKPLTQTPASELELALKSGTLLLPVGGTQSRAKADVMAKRLGDMGALVDMRAMDGQAWLLPDRSKGLVAALLIATALDEIEELDHLFTEDATWGMPDRRRVGSTPVFNGDNGEAFFAAFREVTTRFSADASFKSNVVVDGIAATYRTGAEPMWVEWIDGDEHFVAALRIVQGVARITYVGFSADTSYYDLDTTGLGPIPPPTPRALPNRGR